MASLDLLHSTNVGVHAAPTATSPAAAESRQLWLVYLVCLTLISVPIKNFAYVVPPLYLAWQFFAGDRSCRRTLLLLGIAASLSAVSLMADAVAGQAVNVPGLWLALGTYLPLFIFLGMRLDRRLDRPTFDSLIAITAWFVIIQSLIGAVQFALSRNGDAVAGTFGLLDFYLSSISISQVYFTFTLFGMILFLLLDAQRVLTRVAIVSGLLTCAVAQSGHQTIFFVAAVGLVSLLQLKRIRTVIQSLALIGFVSLMVVQVYPETVTLTVEWYRKVVLHSRSPKRMVVTDSLDYLAEPKNLALGLGMGQYASRAALITSDEYLNADLPDLVTGRSDYYVESMQPAVAVFKEIGEGSAISKPYFSALTLTTELGPGLTLLCLVGFAGHVLHNGKLMRAASPLAARVGMASVAGLIFFLLCTSIENYVEFPQAVFLPLLLYMAAQARVVDEQAHAAAAAAAGVESK